MRDLGGVEAEHVTQDEHRALLWRQPLQPRRERERDRLALLVARVGPGCDVGDAVEQHVGVGLEPDGLGPAARLGHVLHRLDPPRSPRAGPQRVQTAVGRDPVEPRPQRGALVEPLEAAPGGEQRLLHQVLGVLCRADDAVAVELQLAAVALGQLAERVAIEARWVSGVHTGTDA